MRGWSLLPNMRRKTAFATRVAVACRGARVRHSLAKAIHRLFDENGFFWVNTPIITASDAEGAGALFRASTLDLANLPRTMRAGSFRAGFLWPRGVSDGVGAAQCRGLLPRTHQSLHLRSTFCAENSNTSRHLAEFWMIEPEIAFATSRTMRHWQQRS